jgi:PAS domain S-box-containing protein
MLTPKQPLRLLLVEDNPDDAELILDALRQAGYALDCRRVDTEPAFLEHLNAPLDLVLSDFHLPRFSGARALQLTRAHDRDLPFILVSGALSDEAAVTALREGASDYLLKDRLARLGPAVDTALRHHRLRAEAAQAEQARQRTERRYRALIEHSSDGLALVDRDGLILFASAGLERMVGSPPEGLVGQRAFDLMHPNDGGALADGLARLVAEQQAAANAYEFRARHAAGHWVWLEAVATNALDEAEVGAIVVNCRDITERRRADEALRQSEESQRLLQSAMRQAEDAIMITTAAPDARIVFVNPAFCRLMGYASADLLGQPPSRFHGPDTDQGLVSELTARLAQGEPCSGEIVFYRQDGAPLTLERHLTPVREASGRWTHSVSIQRDISGRKQADAVLRRRTAELEAITELSARLRATRTSDEMLPIFLQKAIEIVGGGLGSLYLMEPGTGDLVARGWHPPAPELHKLRHRPGEGVTGRVAATGEVYIAEDLAHDPLPHMLPGEAARWAAARSSISLPLRTQAGPVGVLHIGLPDRRAFSPDEVRLLTAVAEIAGNALHRAELHAQTEQHVRRLTALHAIDATISASLDLSVTLNVLLDQVRAQLAVHAADVLLLDTHSHTLAYAAGRGFRSRAVEQSRARLGEGLAGRVALERQSLAATWPVAVQSSERAPEHRARLLALEGFVAYCGVPLVAKGQTKGVLEIFHRAPLAPDGEWMGFLETLAEQAAIAIDNSELFNDLQRTNLELTLAYDTTLEGWSRALDLRDKETEGHTRRVAEMTEGLGRALNLSDEDLIHIRRGALLHDIGKMAIPDAILFKPGPLDDAEWEIMRRHPVFAYELLLPIAFLRQALDIPYGHHERWDGSGYPRGLRGHQIPLSARLFTVADVWDALRSDRPYRSAWPADRVRKHIQDLSGTHFDPSVVALFLSLNNEP